jgi:hypothetical protein
VFAHTLAQFAKLVLPHVGLVLLTCAYTLVGALVFYRIEGNFELEVGRGQRTVSRSCVCVTVERRGT